MDAQLDNPVTCPECGGKGMAPSSIWRRKYADPRTTDLVADIVRCDICHGIGRIECRDVKALAEEVYRRAGL